MKTSVDGIGTGSLLHFRRSLGVCANRDEIDIDHLLGVVPVSAYWVGVSHG